VTDLGDQLRRAIAGRGLSLRATARRAGCSPGYLSNVIHGRKALTPSVAARLDQALGTAGTFTRYTVHTASDVGSRPDHAGPQCADGLDACQVLDELPASVLAADGRLMGVEREAAGDLPLRPAQCGTRQIADGQLPDLGQVSVHLPSRIDQENAEDVVDVLGRIQKLSRTVNPEVIRHLQDELQHTIARYEKIDHSSLAPALRKQRAFMDAIIGECSHPRQRQQLFGIAGATSGVLGYVAVGRGDFPRARAYCLEAFQLGDFAQDVALKAWARGLQSFCEYYAGRYDQALRLAEDGLAYAKSGPQSVRLTINGVARALGKLGDAKGVHRAVDGAHDLMSHNDVPSGVPSSIAFECYSAAQTASNAATAYVALGMPEKVQHYVSLALPDISKSGSPWSRSLVMIDLALSLIRPRDADLDRAAGLVLDALGISAGRPIISVQRRTSEFAREATGRWGNTRQVSAVLDAESALIEC
jgi:transcriptional regulator with XRE-family HTH domain